MSILITGTTGFVGADLKRFLAEKGHSIIEINRNRQEGTFTFDDLILPECKGDVWIHLAAKSKDVQKPHLLDEYLEANVELTKKVFDAFLNDDTANTFIYVSSVKAAAGRVEGYLTEEEELKVDVPYGISKRLAEKYLLSVKLHSNKRLIILRPAMIFGINSKGNLHSLFSFIKRGLPYPFAGFLNLRSLLSTENFNHVILSIIENPTFKAGIYNVSDDGAISTNEIIEIIGKSLSKKPLLLSIPKKLMTTIARMGDALHLPFNTAIINKLTDNYQVSNKKIVAELGQQLPYKTTERLAHLFKTLASVSKK